MIIMNIVSLFFSVNIIDTLDTLDSLDTLFPDSMQSGSASRFFDCR